NGQKVVCGTPSGALLLYSWGHFKDCSDRFLGHAQSVDNLLKLDEETLISAAADGVIRFEIYHGAFMTYFCRLFRSLICYFIMPSIFSSHSG
uniref:Anaphase-promoting complex subunit 4 WD40 domain-containing protein n=1 Tax=Aegilops tauschii subsp. strangulata TaxID=200361 RepID=A0A452ZMN3_AEGTS